MGHQAVYRCNKCGNEFESHEGGGFVFAEYRCVDCDSIKAVNIPGACSPGQWRMPTKEEVGVCGKCGGELRHDIRPMCPECRSRDVNEKEILINV